MSWSLAMRAIDVAGKIAGVGRKAIGLAGGASKSDFVSGAIERTIAEFGSSGSS
jgi:hypothetical protein